MKEPPKSEETWHHRQTNAIRKDCNHTETVSLFPEARLFYIGWKEEQNIFLYNKSLSGELVNWPGSSGFKFLNCLKPEVKLLFQLVKRSK